MVLTGFYMIRISAMKELSLYVTPSIEKAVKCRRQLFLHGDSLYFF